MLSSILSLPADVAIKLDNYAINLSTDVPPLLKAHYKWTQENFPDADRASSLLQAQWMMRRATEMGAQRVLDVGCYTGLSAVAWYEGTKETQAKIMTIEYDAKLAATARETFTRYGFQDRVTVVEGRAEEAILEMTEPFDIIFIDLEFSAYRPIVECILDRGLLSKNGVILVDNVFARGFAVDTSNLANIDSTKINHWIDSGKLVNDFNSYVAKNPCVSVTLLPFFDGISEIRLKD